ncbi:MAG: PIN domain-containing protein [Thermoplasmata archaeon]
MGGLDDRPTPPCGVPAPEFHPTPEEGGMKALDSGVLRGILEADPGSKELLRRLRGVEVATTERAMLELSLLAQRSPAKLHVARRTAVERLRRKLTVLPIDARAVAEASRRATGSASAEELWRLAEWGALEASGCDELFSQGKPPAQGKWRFKVTRVGVKHPK